MRSVDWSQGVLRLTDRLRYLRQGKIDVLGLSSLSVNVIFHNNVYIFSDFQ